jgi:hypothetical protein
LKYFVGAKGINSKSFIYNVDVYEMRLTGIGGLFYPPKFYFAYRKSPPGQLAAYWCGEGSQEEYYRFYVVGENLTKKGIFG